MRRTFRCCGMDDDVHRRGSIPSILTTHSTMLSDYATTMAARREQRTDLQQDIGAIPSRCYTRQPDSSLCLGPKGPGSGSGHSPYAFPGCDGVELGGRAARLPGACALPSRRLYEDWGTSFSLLGPPRRASRCSDDAGALDEIVMGWHRSPRQSLRGFVIAYAAYHGIRCTPTAAVGGLLGNDRVPLKADIYYRKVFTPLRPPFWRALQFFGARHGALAKVNMALLYPQAT